MRLLPIVLCAALLGQSGCSQARSPYPRADQSYIDFMTLGQSAFKLSQLKVARAQFQKAYGRALLQDDAKNLYDAGYNLAIVELSAGAPEKSLETLKRLSEDLRLRGVDPQEDLSIVEAAALYQLHRYKEVISLTTYFTTERPLWAERMAMFAGLAAFELRDDTLLRDRTHFLLQLHLYTPLVQADSSELLSRLSLREGAFKSAEANALTALSRRRALQDHRGVLRALQCAAAAAEAAGFNTRAQGYRFRAGQVRNELGLAKKGLLPGDDHLSALIISAHALTSVDNAKQK